jgi:hypothetical protein
MQIQLAYLQATQCALPEPGVSLCEQPGKHPSLTICDPVNLQPPCQTFHHESQKSPGFAAGQNIGTFHKLCAPRSSSGITCTVTPP